MPLNLEAINSRLIAAAEEIHSEKIIVFETLREWPRDEDRVWLSVGDSGVNHQLSIKNKANDFKDEMVLLGSC